MSSRLLEILGTWRAPPDPVAWTALAAAVGCFGAALMPVRNGQAASRRRFLTMAGFAAAFLSLGYIAYYLRGAPRIIDATSYYLQGRGLSHGLFAWDVQEPSASFRGRFLLSHDGSRLGGIFPPGYPLLLAAGFLMGAPLVVGPALGAALVVATYTLARELAHGAKEEEKIARLAAVLSVVCVTLRYHTADTMAHAASALGITMALAAGLRARRTGNTKLFALVGLATGYVFATRLASALPIGVVALALATRSPEGQRLRSLMLFAAGVVPGAALLALANHAVTGNALLATQRDYYATSDGPPGCFRYGFGAGVGCVVEHGEFVNARLTEGYGLVEAIGTTLRRLRMHLTDVCNLEPLAVLVLLPLVGRLEQKRASAVALTVVGGQILAYAPFYFDGNYPGGGARLFADVLPIEHALVAVAVSGLFTRFAIERRAFVLLGLGCAGFATHAVNDQISLANRDGARPMFEVDRLREANITHGILFIDTDHGFNLAHDPGIAASHGVVAARLHRDDHDRVLYDLLGHPASNFYRIEAGQPVVGHFVPPVPADVGTYRFEAEADWPVLEQLGGWAAAEWATDSCASGSRVLALAAAKGSPSVRARIELPVPRAGTWGVRPRTFRRGDSGAGTIMLVRKDQRVLATWSFPALSGLASPGVPECTDLAEQTVELERTPTYLVLEGRGGDIALDRTLIDLKDGR